MNFPVRLGAVLLLLAAGSGIAVAGDAPHRALTGPPSHYLSVAGKDYRLAPAHPRDAAGHALDAIRATRIEVKDGEGDWETVQDSELPVLAIAVPPELRDKLDWFYANATGWLAVPRGWKPQRTAVGVDGNTVFSFVAPEGAEAGWMSWELFPACLGCIYEAAQGVFPGAHKQLDTLMETSTPEPVLEPKPDELQRLDRCTARLAYRLPKSPPVRALMVLDQTGDPFFRELAIAVPASSAAVADVLLASFKDAHGGCGKP
ncbi:DUF4850 domain-containing protein [Dyella sp. LX-66]|uniref:DUF4850 domain-containing protein n=1 Tax=unclassified Dyella TaxID=2634549 RepID=UPI001BE01E5A|nr:MULTISPECIES: DUF4850 domain-containing protein [unclassified Dyella]MBT2119463.1 DUF4850 domain-containing protein [Dyella sp. LX-1]MBT2141821.1 DUF4850 domain-containing protein [Dyella sp. LX-66]